MNENALEIHLIGGPIGESIVLRMPNGKWGVVDSYTRNLENPGSNPTLQFLREQGVKELDFICLSHPHVDHFRGMSQLLTELPASEFWIFAGKTPNEFFHELAVVLGLEEELGTELVTHLRPLDEFLQIAKYIWDRNAKRLLRVRRTNLHRLLYEEKDLPSGNPFTISALGPSDLCQTKYEESLKRCLKPNYDGNILAERVPHVNHNYISSALLVKYGGVNIVLGGDLEHEGWTQIFDDPLSRSMLPFNLVKISHHCSKNGYFKDLWQAPGGKNVRAVTSVNAPNQLPNLGCLEQVLSRTGAVHVACLSFVHEMLKKEWEKTANPFAECFSLEIALLMAGQFHNVRSHHVGRCVFAFDPAGMCEIEHFGDAGTIGMESGDPALVARP